MPTKELTLSLRIVNDSRIVSTLLRWNWWENLLSIRPVIHGAGGDAMSHLSVSLVVKNWADGPVDGKLVVREQQHQSIQGTPTKYLLPIHTQAGQLRVQV